MDCMFIKNGSILLSCSYDKTLKLWDTSNWNEITTIKTGNSKSVTYYLHL